MTLSRAFVNEDSSANSAPDLPERPIAPERNLVTPRGLALMEAELERLQKAYSAELGKDDKTVMAQVMRDLKYWMARRASAELTRPPVDGTEVRFGHCVTLESDKGARSFCIVGLDEADPAAGRLSYISPIARLLLGKSVGDTVALPQGEAEITAIRPA